MFYTFPQLKEETLEDFTSISGSNINLLQTFDMYILVKTEERNLQDIVITISIRKDQSAPGVFGLS